MNTPPDRWFILEIFVDGHHIIIKVNGTKTADYVHSQMTAITGHLVLQAANPAAPVEFRKIEIKELDTPAARTAARPVDEPKASPSAAQPARPERQRASLTARRDEPKIREAIKGGVRYLVGRQNPDGSWPDAVANCPTGTTSLVALALLAAGEPPDSPSVARALAFLNKYTAQELGRTYSVALQTMAFAAADPNRFQLPLARNVAWLEQAQIKRGDRVPWPGSWTYTAAEAQGDNSNSRKPSAEFS